MKRFLALGLVLLFLAPALFADDAKVMPMMVGRVYVAPNFTIGTGRWDKDGEFTSYDNSVKVFNLGFAVEYGIINWITAAIQWVPGWTPWSDIKGALTEPLATALKDKDINTNGVADLFAGFKIQIMGAKAPVQNDMFRFAVAPGVVIPLPGPDFEEGAKKLGSDDAIIFSSMDKHVFATGGRVYFDWIINDNFFINIYNETMLFPLKQDLNKDGPNFYLTKGGLANDAGIQGALGLTAGKIMDISGEVNYKYRLTFELEPVFTYPIASGMSFSAGLPINYRYTPAYEYSFDYPEALTSHAMYPFVKDIIEETLLSKLNTEPQHSLTLNPNVGLFLTKTPLPLEFKFSYNIPLYGQNTMAKHTMVFQIRAYFALPGRPQ